MARASRIRSYYGTILDEGRQKINKPRKPNPADDEQIDGTKKDGICLWYLYIYILHWIHIVDGRLPAPVDR